MADEVSLLAELIAADTHNPGGDERALAGRLADELRKRNPDAIELVEVGATRAYVVARWGEPRWIINAHLDTVPVNAGWTGDPFRARVEGGRVIGLGACDTKGAIAAILCALDDARPRDAAVLFSGDEEHTGECMRHFLASGRAEKCARAIACEPTSLKMGTRHRGILAFEARLRGRGGHSSRADALPAPVAELARLGAAYYDWGVAQRERGPEGFRGMCLNVAKLDGGVAFNVVPDAATLSVSLRPPPGADSAALRGELSRIAKEIAPDAEMNFSLDNPPLHTRAPAAFAPLLGRAAAAPADLAFWTEAAMLAGAGIDAVVFGPGDIAQAHAPDEWVPIAELKEARAVFAAAFARGAG